MVKFIYFENELKLKSFKVIHYTNSIEEVATWTSKKKVVEYKPTKVNCSFNVCDAVPGIVSYEKTERSKLYLCDAKLNCPGQIIDIETTQLSNKNESTIIEKIKEALTANKSLKKNQTLFFYLDGKKTENDLDIRFSEEAITIKSLGNHINL